MIRRNHWKHFDLMRQLYISRTDCIFATDTTSSRICKAKSRIKLESTCSSSSSKAAFALRSSKSEMEHVACIIMPPHSSLVSLQDPVLFTLQQDKAIYLLISNTFGSHLRHNHEDLRSSSSSPLTGSPHRHSMDFCPNIHCPIVFHVHPLTFASAIHHCEGCCH